MNEAPHYVGLEVPQDFARVIVEKMGKDRTFQEVLLELAVTGAECARMHKAK